MLFKSSERRAAPKEPKVRRRARRAGAVALSAALLATIPLAAAVAADAQPAAPAKAAAATRVTLTTLECIETEDWTGGDELYIKVNGRTIWTAADSVNDGESIAVNRIVNSGDTVALYDEDSPDADDFLGSDIVEGDHGTLVFNNDDAHYVLYYRPA